MGISRKYEEDPSVDYTDAGAGQVVARSLFAVVERGDMPLDSGFGYEAPREIGATSLVGCGISYAGEEPDRPERIAGDFKPFPTMP